MAREWKVKDRFQVEVGGDAAPPAEAAAPSAKKWNAVNRFPTSYVMPVANDDAPAELPPLSDPGPRGRVSAASPHTVPVASKPSPMVDKPFDPWGGYYSTNRPHAEQDPDSFGAALDDRARELLVDPIVRGYRQTAQASNALSAGMGLESVESAAADIAMREKQLRSMPQADYMTDVLRRIDAITPKEDEATATAREAGNAARLAAFEATPRTPAYIDPYGSYYSPGRGMPPAPVEAPSAGVLPIIGEYLKDPRAALNVALESGAASLTSIAGGAGGGAAGGAITGGPVGAAAGMALGAGAGSFLVEYGSDFIDTIRKSGVDMTDQAAILAAFQNPEIMARARDHAIRRGAAVATFDALSAGLAGRVAKPVERALAKTGSVGARVAPLAGEVTEVLGQGTLGGAGEAAGAIATGEKVDPAAVAQEVIGEFGPGTAEILIGRAQDQKARAQEEEERKFSDALRGAQDAYTRAKAEADARVAPPPPPPPAAPADTMAAPPVSGSPPPDSNSPKASAPIGETGQGVATPPSPPAAPAAAAAPAPEPLTTTPPADKRAGVYDVADSVTAEGPQTERVKVVVRPDGTGFISRGSDVVDISAQLKTGASAETIIANNFSASQKPESVTRIGDLPAAKKTRQKKTAAPPASPAPTVPEPAPVPQTQPGSTTVQEPPASGAAAPTTPTRLELPSRKKGWKGGPDAEIEVVPTDGGFKMRYGVMTPTGGASTPIGHSKVYPTHEEALQYAAKKMRALVEPVAEDGSHQKGENNARKRVREWLDKVAPAPTEHMAAPSEKPGIAPKAKRGTLKSEGIEVEEGQVDEAEIERLFGKRQPAAELGTEDAGRPVSGRSSAPKEDGDVSTGHGDGSARERPDAGGAGRGPSEDGRREASGRTADGRPPRVDWRDKTTVRDKDGTPRTIWRGSAEETSARDFTPEALGSATGHPSAALGVFYTATQDDAANYGTPRPVNLDLRKPKVYTQDTLPDFDSPEKYAALAATLRAKGFDGIRIDHSDVGAPDWYIAFEPYQSIHDAGVAEEEAPSTEGIEVQELSDKAEGKTGVEPEGDEPKGRGTEPEDPLRRIAGKSARKIRKQLARSRIPPRAPKRDQTPGRSNFDTMWRHLLSARDPNFIGPKQPEADPASMERREELVRRFQNKPLPEQMRLAQRRMKHYFDFKDIEIDPKMSPREALDAMLDAYNNLHTMANVMGQPRQAMGFNGELTLQFKKTLGNKGTRGMFSWNFAKGFGASTLALARQADSFTHEWIHALDLGLLMRYFKSHALGVSGLADYTRNPLKALPPKIEAAFTNLLRSLFLVDEAAAQEMARLVMVAAVQAEQLAKAKAKYERTKGIVDAEHERDARAAEHEKNADATKDPFIAAGLRKAATTLRQTTKQAKTDLKAHKAEFEKAKKALAQTQTDTKLHLQSKASQFHKNSAYVDQLTGQQYFSLPAEMLARAGEAHMANRIGQQVGVEFLSGSPNFYNENADRLMALVYPDANEREGINQRFDELYSALTEEQYFEGDTVASQIPGDTVYDKELYIAALTEPRSASWRRFYEARKKDFVHAVMAGKHMLTPSTLIKGGDAALDAMLAWLRSTFWSTSGGGQSLISAYKKNPELVAMLRKFYAMITTNPGARTEVQGQTAQEEIDQLVRQKYAQVDRVMTAHGLDMRDLAQRKALAEEYARPTEQVHSQLKKHKAFLEDALKGMEGDRNKTGEAASIRRYIKRIDGILAAHPIPDNPTEPIQKAALALRKISDEMYKRNKDAGIEMGYVSNYMNRTLNREKIAADRAGFLEQATLAYQMTNLAEHQELQREEKRLENLVKAADAAKKRDVSATPEVESARKKLAEVRAEMVRVSDRNAAEQAEAYLQGIEIPPLFAPQRTTPRTTYTKSRVLGPAADMLLADYYEQNPVQALKHTIATTASRVAYATRFGVASEKLDAMRKELVAAGLDPLDLEQLDDAVKVAFGQTGNFNSAADTAGNWAISLGLMKMLVKAGFTNLPEPLNAGAITGRSLDGFKALGYAYLPILRGADAREHRIVMELLGLTASSMNEALVANRAGIELGDQPLLTSFRAGFGKLSMIHPLTMRGIFGISRVMMGYMNFVATSWTEGTAEQKTEAMFVFNEFGVPPNQRDQFAKFVRSMPKGRPTAMQLLEAGDYAMKQLYGGVINRMTRYAMQDPQRVDRARASFGRVGRFTMSITNFPMSFQRNIMFREFKMIREAKRAGTTRLRGYGAATALTGKVMWFAVQLTLLSMLAGMAREWWDDRERLKKKKLEDFLSAKAALEALDRAGRTGQATSLVNYAFKFKFDRELSALAVGAVPSMYLDNATKISKGFAPGRDRNSPNTMLDERKAWGAVYDMTAGLLAQPVAITLGMTGPTGWATASKINSRGWREAFAETMAPKTPTEKAAAEKAQEKADRSPAEVEIDQEEHDADEADRLELLEMEYGE